jgi:hypothetical protein
MTSTQPEQTDQRAGTYIYCVTSAQSAPATQTDGRALGISGINGEPVRAVTSSDLAAIVSDSPYDSYDVTREGLTAHEQVVEKVMEQADVLPVSFGTVAEDDQAVRQQLLEALSNDLHQALNQVHGRGELGVKVLWVKDRLFEEIAAEDESIQALREQIAGTTPEQTYDERTQLGELIAHAIERKSEQEATNVLNALQPAVVDTRVGNNFTDLMILNASFLVDKQQIPAFEAQLDRLRQMQNGRLIVEYTGLLPPYNFVSIVTGTEEGSQDVEVAR